MDSNSISSSICYMRMASCSKFDSDFYGVNLLTVVISTKTFLRKQDTIGQQYICFYSLDYCREFVFSRELKLFEVAMPPQCRVDMFQHKLTT